MDRASKLNKVLDIALSEETRLLELARLSGEDALYFYEGASLTGLNLAGQDLSGLSFYGADLRHTDLTGVIYSPGSFNGSHIDTKFSDLQDEYEFVLSECVDGLIQRIHFFGTFRPGSLDEIMTVLSITSSDFADLASISTATLRSARRSNRVSMSTLKSIYAAIDEKIKSKDTGLTLIERSKIYQPLISFTYISGSGWQRRLNRKEVGWIIRMMQSINAKTDRYTRGSYPWRENPGLIALVAIHMADFEFEDDLFEAFAVEMKNSTGYGSTPPQEFDDLLSSI